MGIDYGLLKPHKLIETFKYAKLVTLVVLNAKNKEKNVKGAYLIIISMLILAIIKKKIVLCMLRSRKMILYKMEVHAKFVLMDLE